MSLWASCGPCGLAGPPLSWCFEHFSVPAFFSHLMSHTRRVLEGPGGDNILLQVHGSVAVPRGPYIGVLESCLRSAFFLSHHESSVTHHTRYGCWTTFCCKCRSFTAIFGIGSHVTPVLALRRSPRLRALRGRRGVPTLESEPDDDEMI